MGGDFRETLYTVDKRGHRRWVYSTVVFGRFFKARTAVAALLLVVYLLMPWINIGGEQAVHFDLPARRLVLWGNVFWATDTIFLMLLLGFLGMCLFFFTALLGRVWCGWACPETIFLEFVFRPIERFLEGSPVERRRRDEGPWNFDKIWRKATKLTVFGLIASVLANTAVAYFVGSDRLIAMVSRSPFENPEPFILMAVLSGFMLFQFGWFREQFCTVLCPYARFQSVLMDAHSLTVGYDPARGEPRGKVHRAAEAGARTGDCVDCGLCVRVCPTGIDIRNGSQLECVACSACADACDSIMTKIGRAPGLVRYATENELAGGKRNFFRPRVAVYAAIIIIYISVGSYLLSSRVMTDVDYIRGALDVPFTVISETTISNHLTVKVANKDGHPHAYRFSSADPDIQVVVPIQPLEIPSGATRTAPLFITFPRTLLAHGKMKVVIVAEHEGGFRYETELPLLGPDQDRDSEEEDDEEEEGGRGDREEQGKAP